MDSHTTNDTQLTKWLKGIAQFFPFVYSRYFFPLFYLWHFVSQTKRHLEQMVDDLNAGRPQCPVGLNTLVIPRKATLTSTEKQPVVYLNCGHVQGLHEWGHEKDSNSHTCPMCLKVMHFPVALHLSFCFCALLSFFFFFTCLSSSFIIFLMFSHFSCFLFISLSAPSSLTHFYHIYLLLHFLITVVKLWSASFTFSPVK